MIDSSKRILLLALVAFLGLFALAANTVPTDIQIPGTQPVGTDNPPTINTVGNCGCHSFSAGSQPPESVPVFGWQGGMMANAGRDPLFWSTVAIAEQDFVHDDVPGLDAGGVGDLCLHCHSVKGWLEGRSTPTNGSGLSATTDGEGIMCEFCHLLVDPDEANNIPSPPEGSYVEEQNSPFFAFDDDSDGNNDGDGYYGGAEYVLNSGGTRLGPYVDNGAKHAAIPSPYFRDARFCGTCHDVSNPAVGDLAPNHGAMSTPAGFVASGVPNGPVTDKAALNNEPHTYGIVERTFSEYTASALDTTLVSDFSTLSSSDPRLVTPGGALEVAYQKALWGTCSSSGDFCKGNANCGGGETCTIPANNTDYEDGTPRYYTCQTCHMAASGGDGATQGRPSPHKGEIRPDLPRHDQTGMSYWIQDAVIYQDNQGILVFGGGLTASEIDAMNAAKLRSQGHLQSAAALDVTQQPGSDHVDVRVTNLTGHKLISGYPEGRRMWLNLVWKQGGAGGTVLREDGAYGQLGVTVQDRDGDPWLVESILAPGSTKVYQAKPAMSQDWAAALRSLNYPADMPLGWDRIDGSVEMTLEELATEAPGTKHPTFHFVLNNEVYKDNRIPPFGFDYDVALTRNALPVPDDQFGDPGSGGIYDHHDDVDFNVPPGADTLDVRLLYQATSWEYMEFLWLQNYGSDDVDTDSNGTYDAPGPDGRLGDAFLGREGVHMIDAWLNTGMSAPLQMAAVTSFAVDSSGAVGHLPGEAFQTVSHYDRATGRISLAYAPGCDAADHTIYYGDLADVSTATYSGSKCFVGVDGKASFNPQMRDAFFLIVANDGTEEGSYGLFGDGATERGEDTGTAFCDLPQGNLVEVTCE